MEFLPILAEKQEKGEKVWTKEKKRLHFGAAVCYNETEKRKHDLINRKGGTDFMKNKALLAAALLTALVITSLLSAVFADEEKAEKIVRIESGQTLWRYRVTTTSDFDEFDSDWYRVGYDASAWSEGVSPFGDRLAGGTDAGWEGEKHALFLITTFWVEESHPAQELSLFADIFYDNTMTVYLNGAPIFFDDGWVDSETTLTLSSETLVSGANTLAISLLDNMGGREFDMTLYTLPRHAAPPIPPVTTERAETSTLAVSDEALTAAGLPIVRIDTEDGDYVTSRIDYVDAVMQIDPGSRYPEEAHLYTAPKGAAIEIRGRGNSTWNNGYRDGKPNTLPGDTHTRKVPYNIKLEEKVSLFGMVKSKKWVLLANYMDRSNLRNKLIFDLSGQMGMYSTRSVFVNLVLNGEYMGVYMLCEKVDIDLFGGIVTDFEDYAEDFAKAVANDYGYDKAWRSAFEEELCENLSWLTEETYKGYRVADYVDLSGVSTKTGFLLEYDGYADEDSFFITEHGVPLKVSNLEYIKSNPTVFNGLKAYISEFEEALFSDTFYNRCGKHYSEYLDMEAFVDYFLLNTLILNVEFGYKSMYMVLNPDGKLVLGPCWDYDWSSGNPFLGATASGISGITTAARPTTSGTARSTAIPGSWRWPKSAGLRFHRLWTT